MFVNTSKCDASNNIFQDGVFHTKDGSTFTTLQKMPYASYGQCLVIVDNDTLFLAGFSHASHVHEIFKYTKTR
jgi:hypothetical protein